MTDRSSGRVHIYPFFALAITIVIAVSGLILADVWWIVIPLGATVLFFAFLVPIKRTLGLLAGAVISAVVFSGFTYLASRDLSSTWTASIRCLALFAGVMPATTIDPPDISRSLDSLHCPRSVTLPILVMFSFFPVLFRERRLLIKAYRVRRKGRMGKPFIIACLVPLIVRVVDLSDNLSTGLLCRGFDMGPAPAVYFPRYPKALDIVVLVVGLLLGAGVIGVGICLA